MTVICEGASFTKGMARDYAGEIAEQGYCIVRNAVQRSLIDAVDTDLAPHFEAAPFCTGDFYGNQTKRFNRLLLRSQAAAELVLSPLVMAVAERLLHPWCDTVQLNLSQAIEIHPGAVAQPPHRDQDSWPFARHDIEYCLNVMWPLTSYREENGATVLWPGSNRRQDALLLPCSEAIAAEMEPGDCLIFSGSTLHHGGANISDEVRRGVIVGYALGWLKPHENQWLAYPPEVARSFPPELAALVGYRQHSPNLGNWEGRCPSLLLGDGRPPDLPGPIDHLAPDKAALIKAFLNGELAQAG